MRTPHRCLGLTEEVDWTLSYILDDMNVCWLVQEIHPASSALEISIFHKNALGWHLHILVGVALNWGTRSLLILWPNCCHRSFQFSIWQRIMDNNVFFNDLSIVHSILFKGPKIPLHWARSSKSSARPWYSEWSIWCSSLTLYSLVVDWALSMKMAVI